MQFRSIERASDAFQKSVSPDQIAAMCRRAFGNDAVVISAIELEGGSYNNTYRVEITADHPVILRVAPEPSQQFRSERELMRNEHMSLPFFAPIAAMMPRILFSDWTHEIIERDYSWQAMLNGLPAVEGLNAYPRSEWAAFYRQLGTIAKNVHEVHGARFGSLTGPTFSTWSEAMLFSLEAIVRDLEDADLDAADVRKIIVTATDHKAVLDEINQPRLLHGDLWTPNLMIAADTTEPTIVGVLDHDRSSWGDPAADWTTFMIGQRPGTERDAFWETYGDLQNTAAARWRSLIYQARHIGAIRLERYRLGPYRKIPDSYEMMRKVLGFLAR
jgi:aminoglycoside phosphotransferase (APT) family kinase protein